MLLDIHAHINVYLFDDWLQRPECSFPTLLTMEIAMLFPRDRVTVWSPNLKPEIVDALRGVWQMSPDRPWLVAGEGCYCAFNAAWASDIHAAGGLDVVFADGFGTFLDGAGQLLRDFADRRLFRQPTQPNDRGDTHVLWVASFCAERWQQNTDAQTKLDHRDFLDADVFPLGSPYVHFVVSKPVAYGKTMYQGELMIQTR